MLDLIEARTVYNDRLREAEQERIAQRMRKQQPAAQNAGYLQPLMASVGDSLIALGYRLKGQSELSLDYSRR